MNVDLTTPPGSSSSSSILTEETKIKHHPLRRLYKKITTATGFLLIITLISFLMTIILFVIVYTVGTIGPVPTLKSTVPNIDVKKENTNEESQLDITNEKEKLKNAKGEKGDKGNQGPEGPEGPQDNAQNPPLEEWQAGTCIMNQIQLSESIQSTYHFKFKLPFLSGNPIVTGSLCYIDEKSNFHYSLHNVTDKGFALTIFNSNLSHSPKDFELPINFQFFAYIPEKFDKYDDNSQNKIEENNNNKTIITDYYRKEISDLNYLNNSNIF